MSHWTMLSIDALILAALICAVVVLIGRSNR